MIYKYIIVKVRYIHPCLFTYNTEQIGFLRIFVFMANLKTGYMSL